MIFLKRCIVEEPSYDSEMVAVYIALRSIYNNAYSNTLCITINSLCYALVGTLKISRNIRESVSRGLDKLISAELIVLIEHIGKEYVLDVRGLYIEPVKSTEGKHEYYTSVTEDEVHKIFNTNERVDKFAMIRFFVVMMASIDFTATISDKNDRLAEKNNFVGYMPQSFLASKAQIGLNSCISYIGMLEELEMIYVYRHKVHLDKNNEIARHNNNYGRFKDAELIKQYATGICDFYCELDSEQAAHEREANRGRSLMQKYNCMRNGVQYDESTRKEIYDYIHAKNLLVKEMIDKCENDALKDKMCMQLKDESVFEKDEWIAQIA